MSKVKLIAITKPIVENIIDHYEPYVDEMGAEDLISYCARVSNPDNQTNFQTSGKLLKYCMDHKHWSIFEMVNIVIEINTTRDIARQILRHGMRPEEFSQRYADPNKLGFTIREARLQDKKNRQNSIEFNDEEIKKAWIMKQEQIIHEAKLAYKWAIENGIAKECARVVLPEGNTNSRLYFNGNLRNWYHYCILRMGPETQKEHREIALAVWEILNDQFPFLKTVDTSDIIQGSK